MEYKKKNNKSLIVVIIILVILLIASIGCLGYGYIKYKDVNKDYEDLSAKYNEMSKKIDDVNNKLEDETNNDKYEFDLSTFKCSDASKLSCVKNLDVRYNNQKHSIKIESSREKVNNSQVKITHNIYDNGSLLQTIKGGSYSDVDYSDLMNDNWDFDGFVYVFDSKYLAFVLPNYDGRRGYDATFINSQGKLIKKINVELAWTSFGTDSNSDLDSISNLEFDGHMLKVWDLNCNGNGAVQVGITFNNDNSLSFKKINTVTDINVGGGEVSGGCKFSKENIA